MKGNYYKLTNLKNFANKHGCIYRLLFGKRSNGKTFSVLGEGLTEWAKGNGKIAYIRRYKEDITKPNLETLFDPQLDFLHAYRVPNNAEKSPVVSVDYQSRHFKFVYADKTKSETFCDCFSLSAWERQKGADRGKYCIIVFDEFITRDSYLSNEVDTFQDVISSIMRDRDGVPVYFIANTVSQHCPYFAAFGFKIKDIKQGDLKQVSPLCCVEYCNDNGRQNNAGYFTAFNNSHSKMILSGAWDFRRYPTLYPKSHLDFNFQFRFFVRLSDRTICGEVLTDKTGAFIYFYPFTGAIKHPETTVIYGGGVDTNILHAGKISDTPTSAHIIINDLINRQKCFYSDNETGDAVSAFINNNGDI